MPSGLDVARAETLFHALLMGLIGNWTMSPRSFNLQQDAEAFVDAYLDMLRLSPALKGTGRSN